MLSFIILFTYSKLICFHSFSPLCVVVFFFFLNGAVVCYPGKLLSHTHCAEDICSASHNLPAFTNVIGSA